MQRIKTALNLYAAGKKWYWYLPFFGITIIFLYQVTQLKLGSNSSPALLIPFGMLDFGIHELGHWITIWAPSIVTAASGSGLEILFPILVVYASFKYRQYFTGMMALSWVALAMSDVGQYMADARAQKLPLIAMDGGDVAIHDWNFVFGKLHLLNQDHLIGGAIRGFGFILGCLGIIGGAYLIYKMAASTGTSTETSKKPISNKEQLLMNTATNTVGLYPSAEKLNLGHDAANASPSTSQSSTSDSAQPQQKPGPRGAALTSLYPQAYHGRLADTPQDKPSQASPEHKA